MARVTISGPTTKVTDPILGGAPVAALKAWFDFAKGQRSVVATTVTGLSSIEVNSEDITMAPIMLALSEGFTVEGAPIFIKMSAVKYSSGVPVGISNRLKQDNTVRQWSEWKDDTHEHISSTDGDKIVPGNSWGVELSSDELVVLLGLTGYTLLLGQDVAQYVPTQGG